MEERLEIVYVSRGCFFDNVYKKNLETKDPRNSEGTLFMSFGFRIIWPMNLLNSV